MAYLPASHGHHEERPRVTTNHDEIRRWIEANGGRPAKVRGNLDEDAVGLLRIDMPGTKHHEALAPISWEEFFRKFEDRDLALLYRKAADEQEKQRFYQLVHRGNLHSQ